MSTKYCRLCCDDLFESPPANANCRVFEFSCGHRLHKDCVLSWTTFLGPRSSCPICEGVTSMMSAGGCGAVMPKNRVINTINKPVVFKTPKKSSLSTSKPLITRPAAYLPYSSPLPKSLQLPFITPRTSSISSSSYTSSTSSNTSTPSLPSSGVSDGVLFEVIQKLQRHHGHGTVLRRA